VALRIVEEAALTDVGRQRHANEDAYYDSRPFFAVADGMGGARAGEVAARIAVEEFDESRDEDAAPEAELERIAQDANRKIHQLAQEDESRSGMGTTLTAVRVGNRDVTIGHVGDSRAYVFRDEELERLTSDHSLVEQLVREGKLSPEQAEVHPQRSIITRALGPEPDVDVETLTYPARDGDVYLICSDGLTSMVPEEEVAAILRRRSSLEQAARDLVDAANRAGGRDNITVILFRLGSLEDAAAVDTAEAQGETTELAEAAPEPEPEPGRRRRRRRRRVPAAAVIVVVALALVLAGGWAASRAVYFVGADTERANAITLYRGLPYELPFGIELYERFYSSGVPLEAVAPHRRVTFTEHKLRSRDDAENLVRQLERGQLR
jgi:PPM family protein phosphatase